ncbi:DUF1622 domain-containing protein [Microbacterium lacticum]
MATSPAATATRAARGATRSRTAGTEPPRSSHDPSKRPGFARAVSRARARPAGPLHCGRATLARKESARAAYLVLRNTLGAAILLGLEVLVAADLIRTITSKPSIEDALILGLIVVIRTVLSMSIQIEIEGVLPWRRALLTSGGQLLGEAVARDRAASTQTASADS